MSWFIEYIQFTHSQHISKINLKPIVMLFRKNSPGSHLVRHQTWLRCQQTFWPSFAKIPLKTTAVRQWIFVIWMPQQEFPWYLHKHMQTNTKNDNKMEQKILCTEKHLRCTWYNKNTKTLEKERLTLITYSVIESCVESSWSDAGINIFFGSIGFLCFAAAAFATQQNRSVMQSISQRNDHSKQHEMLRQLNTKQYNIMHWYAL